VKRVLGILTVGLLAGLTLTAAQRAETSRQVECRITAAIREG
jgi:hypothetical protein